MANEEWKIILTSEDSGTGGSSGSGGGGVGGTSTSSAPGSSGGSGGGGMGGSSKMWGDIAKLAGVFAGSISAVMFIIQAFRRSKILSTFMDNMLTILGAVIDMMLIPMIPYMVPVLMKMLTWLQNPAGFIITALLSVFAGAAGGALGASIGSSIGGFLGSILPGIGTAIGAIIGAAIGLWLTTIDWGQLWKDASTFFGTTLPNWWNSSVGPFFTRDLPNWWNKLIFDISDWFVTKIINPFIDWINGLSTWLKGWSGINMGQLQHVAQPTQPITIVIKMPSGQQTTQTINTNGLALASAPTVIDVQHFINGPLQYVT